MKISAIGLKKSITSVLALIALINLAVVILTVSKTTAQRADGVVVNVAGRQRMLNQRHMKEVLLRINGADVNYASTRNLFLASLKALTYGGKVPMGKGKFAHLPKAPNKELHELLLSQKEHFEQVVRLADDIIANRNYSRLMELNKLVGETHVVANNAVSRFASVAGEKVESLLQFQYAGFLFILLMISFSIFSLLRFVVRDLKQVSKNLSDNAQIYKNAAKDISHNSDSLVSGIDEQATGVHETIASMSQLSGMVETTVNSASSGQATAEAVTEEIHSSQNKVNEMLATIEQVNYSVSGLFNSIISLQKHTNADLQKINDVIDSTSNRIQIINDIAQKTEILSFNASIEAARAGRHGKGFAIVADEVGKLARLTGKSAEEINTLVADSRSTVKTIGDKLNEQVGDSKGQVETCQSQAENALESGKNVAHSLVEVINGVGEMRVNVTSIVEACEEEKKGLYQIRDAMDGFQKAIDIFQNVAAQNNTMISNLHPENLVDASEHIRALVDGYGVHQAFSHVSKSPHIDRDNLHQAAHDNQRDELLAKIEDKLKTKVQSDSDPQDNKKVS